MLRSNMMKKVKDHCHVTRKYRGSVNRDCNIKVNLNPKIPTLFHNLKKHNSYLITQEPGKFNFKINAISSGLEK